MRKVSTIRTISGIVLTFGLVFSSLLGIPALTSTAIASETLPSTTPLTAQTAHDISTGRIRLENGQIDQLLYGKPALDPNEDSDGDGLKNSEELYTYTKDGRTYYGYKSHPLIKDTDGDGLDDKDDKNPRRWDISPRDMALFMELAYREDNYVNKVLDDKHELTEIYKDRNEYKLMHNELAPYWKVKKTYHESDGFDAVLFENVNPEYPFIEQNGVQVLGIRGTQGAKDASLDLKLFFGGEISQATTTEKLMDELNNNHLVSNLYVTGHSLGGYLTERALVYAKRKNYDWFTKAYTFNAPKIKGSVFRPSMKKRAEELNELTKKGYAEHYATKKDTLISFIGHVDGAKIIDTGNNGHSSRNFLDKKMDNQLGFTVGNRKQIDGTGTVNPGVTKVKETPKPAEVKPYEETYKPEVKEILLANNEPSPSDFKDALANAKDLPQGATFEDVTNRDLINISKAGDYTGKLKIKINGTKTIEKEFTIRVVNMPEVTVKSDANLRFELNSTFPNDFDAKKYLDGVPSNAKVSLLNTPNMNTKGVQDITVKVSFVNGTKRTVKIPVKIYEATPWANLTPAQESIPWTELTPATPVTPTPAPQPEPNIPTPPQPQPQPQPNPEPANPTNNTTPQTHQTHQPTPNVESHEPPSETNSPQTPNANNNSPSKSFVEINNNTESLTNQKQAPESTEVPEAPKSIADLLPELTNTLTVGNNNIAYAGKNNQITVSLNTTAEFMRKLQLNKAVKAYAYIYSSPKLLYSVNGTRHVTVRINKQGKAIFDAIIPQEYSGNHTIVLIDENGKQVAWTNVLVKKNESLQNNSSSGIVSSQTHSASVNNKLPNTGIQVIPAVFSTALILFVCTIITAAKKSHLTK
ncbi:Rib/alpha-like domain-containing protein [Gardnerella pickettii]|uniref:LPXTG-motif protein cell wall anchor domain protein n=1 Tax=Gardnerella pickettii JCP8017A TaxID=1261062 RepID=T2PKH3_9BIFI|nr:Rib/alpha-like domain-containing protein [Gardnerella pickettii]EPI52222.1 LPXTG-motif protein cell wall anchor domain protein [Gardnerella pickettii JCP8017A]EPI62066.1 LPXTG-motif protein cell wall anchor domain protein [Gardnerella pickettii JCP8017B]PKZ39832.1 peptidase [Gardnerella pickettii]